MIECCQNKRAKQVQSKWMVDSQVSWSLSALVCCSKLYGRFDWLLSKFLHNEDPEVHLDLPPGPYFSGKPASRVLAISTFIDLSRTRSAHEFQRIVIGLLQVL